MMAMLRIALDAAHDVKSVLTGVTEQKAAYKKMYSIFHKLLLASDKRIPFIEITDYIDKIKVDAGKQIVVKWSL